jgi:hypothetical protein
VHSELEQDSDKELSDKHMTMQNMTSYNLRGMKRYWPHDYYIIIKLAQVSKKKLMPIPGVR